MEAKQAKSGSAVAARGIESADKQIAMLKDRLLPYDPHIVIVPSKLNYNGGHAHEHRGTPFEDYEVRDLQYLTLVGETDRETARPWPAAEWMDTIEARSPASLVARSNTTTPNAAAAKESKIPSKKISIADYKNMKKTGATPASLPNKPGHTRNASAVYGGEPLSRDPSFESAHEPRQNGATSSANSVRTEKGAVKAVEKPAVQSSGLSNAKARPPATTNGHTSDHNRSKENVRPQSTHLPQRPTEHIKHSLPPRPQSPPRSNPTYNLPDPKQQKRPLEAADATQPEKRSKIEHTRTPSNSQNHSRTPSGSQHPLPRKPNTPSDARPSSLKSQNAHSTSAHASPQTKKGPLSKMSSKENSRPEKPLDLPPLLSPLPAELGSSPHPTGFTAKENKGKRSAQGTPSKYGLGADTIIVKKAPSPLAELSQSSSSRAVHSPESFDLPALLSPTLPDVVEQELLRLQAKSAALNPENRLNSVEARHEKARRPDTPGVARKTTTPKVGHPPKKPQAESSKVNAEKTSLLVKLKYKKRKAQDVQRILGLKAKPSPEYLRLEKERQRKLLPRPDEDDDSGEEMRTPNKNASSASKKRIIAQKPSRRELDDDSDDVDEPLSKTAGKAPAPAPRKRPSDPIESRAEPVPKRKAPEIDVAKSKTVLEPAFKSPALSQPSQRNLLATPKKGDAMKSVSMRKVNSSDGHAHTPQASTSTPQASTSTSTPASAEKPRINGVSHGDPKKDLGTFLKRKMDSILHLKDGLRDTVDDTQRKLGLSVAFECVTAYMVAFSMSDARNKRRAARDWDSVVQLWEFINGGLAKGTPLQSLCFELGALCREELCRAYLERLSEKNDPETQKLLQANSARKDKLWISAHMPVLASTGPQAGAPLKEVQQVRGNPQKTMGPWTNPRDAKEYTFEVLHKYARVENTGWKPEKEGNV
ncbi:uncharacterized protein PAC_03546 [Phialocephala subalpina]|uniref:Uncharacterized protein n=1 Tax=Phialocephala subalpina TaxID=576137 RepID=A0A1L7WLM5_9HELO|nr:uncharacterized protein PAC_03546 [Phialocephala subalpina]